MNKQGALPLNLLMVFGMTIVLIYAWTIFDGKYNSFDKKIGEKQYEILNAYLKGEKILMYVDQSAKYALGETIKEFSANGGISEVDITEGAEAYSDYECGRYNGAYVWFELEKAGDKYNEVSCLDESAIESNFEHSFNQHLNEFFSSGPYNIPLDNYVFEVKGDITVIGRPIRPIEVKIYEKGIDEEIIIRAQEKAPSEISKVATVLPEGLRDFTGTALCAKGSQCLLSEEAFNLAIKAQEIATQKGVSLEITEGYRSAQEQIDIWEGRTAMRWAQRIPDEQKRRAKVCYPYGEDIEKRCSHLSGNAVDLRFKGRTIFTMTVQERKLLHDIMTSAGWIRLGDEKNPDVGEHWHFECCNTERYARAREKGVTAIV